MSELRRIDDALPRSACSSSLPFPFFPPHFFSSFLLSFFLIFSHFFFIPPSSSLPSLDPLINAGVKLLFISDRDLGNGGEPPIDQGEKIVTRSGIDRNEPRRE